jgi:hypothetical protein
MWCLDRAVRLPARLSDLEPIKSRRLSFSAAGSLPDCLGLTTAYHVDHLSSQEAHNLHVMFSMEGVLAQSNLCC